MTAPTPAELAAEIKRLAGEFAYRIACCEHAKAQDDREALHAAIDRLAALAAPAEPPKPVAWIRFCSDGCYEGPLMDSRMDDVRKKSGAWTPLYASPTVTIDGPEAFRDLEEASKRLNDEISAAGGLEAWRAQSGDGGEG